MIRRPPRSTLFPTRRSSDLRFRGRCQISAHRAPCSQVTAPVIFPASYRRHIRLEDSASETRDSPCLSAGHRAVRLRSEEHTSELQSQSNLVCRLLLEKKKKR